MEGDRDDPQRVAFPAPYILVYEWNTQILIKTITKLCKRLLIT
jgi:hypothetical protein